jgi:hypothetical protein
MDEDEELDPLAEAILNRIDFDLARGAAVPLTQELLDAIHELVGEVEVDLDAPLEGEIIDLSVEFRSLKSNERR